MDIFNRLKYIFFILLVHTNLFAESVDKKDANEKQTKVASQDMSQKQNKINLNENLTMSYEKEAMMKIIQEKAATVDYEIKTFSLFNLKNVPTERVKMSKEDGKINRNFVRVDFIIYYINPESNKNTPYAVKTNIQKYVLYDTFWGDKYEILEIFQNGIRVQAKNIDEKFLNNLLQDKKNKRNIKLINNDRNNSVIFNIFIREKFDLDSGEFFY